MVGASVDLLPQPVQSAVDGARHRLLFHRGSVRRRGYRPDGGDLDAAQLHPGGALDQSGGCAEGDGEQYRHRAAGGQRAGGEPLAGAAYRPAGAGRHYPVVGGGYDPGGPAYPAGAGSVRRPGLADRRIAAGGESGPQPRSAAAKPAGVRHPVLYGHQRGERLGAGHRLRHRRPHLVWSTGRPRQRAGERAERLPERHQPGEHAADPLYAGDGPGGAADQWLHQRRLVGGGAIRAVGGGRLDAGDAADDRHFDAGARGGEAVEAKGHREAPRRHSEFRRDGHPLH